MRPAESRCIYSPALSSIPQLVQSVHITVHRAKFRAPWNAMLPAEPHRPAIRSHNNRGPSVPAFQRGRAEATGNRGRQDLTAVDCAMNPVRGNTSNSPAEDPAHGVVAAFVTGFV